MKIEINGSLPKETDIDGVPAVFLMPPQENKFEQLDLSKPAKPRVQEDKYTPYQERIRDCFAKAYKFFDDHKHARTLDDFTTISRELGKIGATPDPLLRALLVAAFEELEREYVTAGDTDHEKRQDEEQI